MMISSTSNPYRPFWLPVVALALAAFRVAVATEREAVVDVWTVEAPLVTGRLVSFSLRDGAILQTGAEKQIVKIPTVDIIRMTKRLSTAPDAGTGGDPWTITLTWGDELRGRVLSARGETVVIETADLGEVPIPLEAIARFVLARVGATTHRQSLNWLDRESTPSAGPRMSRSARGPSEADDDLVLLTNGDVLRGFISAIDADGISIDTGIGPTMAPFRLVIGARLAHPKPAATPQPYLLLTLRNSGTLTATALDWSEAGVEARLRGGAAVQIDADRVMAVGVMGGRWEWLTDHRPISYEQVPMLGPGWEYLPGRSVSSAPILVAGESYERGIGVHSRSNLVFELGGVFREFVTSFGMDDDSGPLADVTAVILVDGQRRFEKHHIRRGTLFGPIRIDVTHAGRIELVVEYGDNGDMQDRFDWVEPGLIK